MIQKRSERDARQLPTKEGDRSDTSSSRLQHASAACGKDLPPAPPDMRDGTVLQAPCWERQPPGLGSGRGAKAVHGRPARPQHYQHPAWWPGFPEEGAGLPLLLDLGLSVTFSIFPNSLVHQHYRRTEGLSASLSQSHCNVQSSPAGTRGSGAAGPHPAPAPGPHISTNTSHKATHNRFAQHLERVRSTQQSSRDACTCEMQLRLR